jgi:hypothetical protein
MVSLDKLEHFSEKPKLDQSQKDEEKSMRLESIYEWLIENKNNKGRKKEAGGKKDEESEIKIKRDEQKKNAKRIEKKKEIGFFKKEIQKNKGEDDGKNSEAKNKRKKLHKNKLNKFIEKKIKKS